MGRTNKKFHEILSHWAAIGLVGFHEIVRSGQQFRAMGLWPIALNCFLLVSTGLSAHFSKLEQSKGPLGQWPWDRAPKIKGDYFVIFLTKCPFGAIS